MVGAFSGAGLSPLVLVCALAVHSDSHEHERRSVGVPVLNRLVASLAQATDTQSALIAAWARESALFGSVALAAFSPADLFARAASPRQFHNLNLPTPDPNASQTGANVVFFRPEGDSRFQNHVAIARIAQLLNLAPPSILVLHADITKELGTASIKRGGGIAGHHGLRLLTTCLGSNDYSRVRIGIGRSETRSGTANYVSQLFTEDEIGVLENRVHALAGKACFSWILHRTQELAATNKKSLGYGSCIKTFFKVSETFNKREWIQDEIPSTKTFQLEGSTALSDSTTAVTEGIFIKHAAIPRARLNR
ncbi:hypothetical protein HDU84_008793 [Entophlyctis sp. JEL0112]|nr:hypothetical protein HDU84_008793 [Entophlyctis sp. JEL0112]